MQAGPKINMRGPYGTSGGHFMTGPIYVCGAEPGDILQVCPENLTEIHKTSADQVLVRSGLCDGACSEP